MGRAYVVPAAVVGAIATVAAMLLPWARYGGIEVRLFELPGWPLYLAAAAAQQLCVLAGLRSRVRGGVRSRRVATAILSVAFGAAAVVAAIALMVAGQQPATVFGQVVPLVPPAVSSGGLVAVAAAAISGAVSLLATRVAAPASVGQQPAGPPAA